jgi:5-methylcytosine-specific restriction enzyme subunit McrC
MKSEWLFNILKDNTLVDNQSYIANDCILTNRRLHEEIKLKKREGNQWRYSFNDEGQIWNFLNTINRNLNKLVQNGENKSLVLFNSKDYEHNTDDNLINLSGIDSMNFTLVTGNLIGYVKQGEYSLKISSRFGDNFLRQIVADADGFLEIENYGGSTSNEGFEWLLIYLWKIKLKKAYRLGLPKKYVAKSERLNKVRGQIDPISYFINGYEGKYNCNYREHSYDNPTTRLVTEVFNKIKNNDFISDLNQLKNAFLIATNGQKSKRIDLLNTTHFSNPFYYDYNDVIDLSKLILREELADFGENSNSSAFLFDISMLFEYFIRKQLQYNGIRLEDKFEKKIQIPTGVKSFKRKLIPDLVINHNESLHVFDVKYKAFDFKHGVSREDLFQIHTYIGQYGNLNKIKSCGFIYPIEEEKLNFNKQNVQNIYEEKLKMMNIEISFFIIFLKIPTNNSENYSTEFKENIKHFIDTFLSKISN